MNNNAQKRQQDYDDWRAWEERVHAEALSLKEAQP